MCGFLPVWITAVNISHSRPRTEPAWHMWLSGLGYCWFLGSELLLKNIRDWSQLYFKPCLGFWSEHISYLCIYLLVWVTGEGTAHLVLEDSINIKIKILPWGCLNHYTTFFPGSWSGGNSSQLSATPKRNSSLLQTGDIVSTGIRKVPVNIMKRKYSLK